MEVTKRLDPGCELYTNYSDKYPWNQKVILPFYAEEVNITRAFGKRKRRVDLDTAPASSPSSHTAPAHAPTSTDVPTSPSSHSAPADAPNSSHAATTAATESGQTNVPAIDATPRVTSRISKKKTPDSASTAGSSASVPETRVRTRSARVGST